MVAAGIAEAQQTYTSTGRSTAMTAEQDKDNMKTKYTIDWTFIKEGLWFTVMAIITLALTVWGNNG